MSAIQEKQVETEVELPEWLNDLAEQANIDLSAVLQQALKQHLGIL